MLQQIQARVERFFADQDLAAVWEPGAVSELIALRALAPDTSPDLEVALAAGWLHWARCLAGSPEQNRQDLLEALTWFALVYPIHPDGVPDQVRAFFDRQGSIVSQATDLLRRTTRTGDPDALATAIDLLRRTLTTTPLGISDRGAILSALGIALRIRYERGGIADDLDAAVAAGREGVEATAADDPERPGRLSNLGGTLQTRFERTGVPADLDDAITAIQDAVTGTPTEHPERAGYLSNLGIILRIRFERIGSLTDLHRAVAVSREGAMTTPPGHPEHAGRFSNLCGALQTRFSHTGMPADIDEAVTAGRQAVQATPAGYVKRAMYLANLCVALRSQFQLTGAPDNLDESIAAGEAAVAATPIGHTERPRRLSNLAGALETRFRLTSELADLDAAIIHHQDAVTATPIGHPDRAGLLFNLSVSLRTRFERAGGVVDLDQAILASRDAVAVTGASPRIQVRAAVHWGSTAARGKRWAEAVVGYNAAAERVGQLTPRSLDRLDQEHLLVELGSLGADAAVSCIHAGQLERAVELFEAGRGVLLGQALDTRTDLTALADRHPNLADEFTRLRDVLDRPPTAGVLPSSFRLRSDAVRVSLTDADGAEGRQAAGTAFDALIDKIRLQAGFQSFLRPPSISELHTASSAGPVVIVAVSVFGSHALLLTSQSLEALPLPELTPQAVYEQVLAFLTSLDSTPVREKQLGEVLSWLWDHLAAPVLDTLGMTSRPADGQGWPRMWWCTSGLLSLLPIHAAGQHTNWFDPTAATLLDTVISSTTPNLRALLHARRPNPNSEGGQILAVGMPHTPGATSLPGASTETAALARRFPDHVIPMVGPEATRQAVTAALPTTRWAHFACHGTAEITSPWDSRLLLHDGPLTVTDVIRLRLDQSELAFLSACETARPGGRVDEAVHLASAFQLAGFRHVIATLWPINDVYAVEFADTVYTAIADGKDPAAAVHQAVRDVRDYQPRSPSLWASHLHAGT